MPPRLITVLLILGAGIAPGLGAPAAGEWTDPIIRRHDREDARYLELGATYQSVVCGVGGATGTLIGDRWLLTAAHVAWNISPFTRTVVCSGTSYPIARVYTYPGWTPPDGSNSVTLDLQGADAAVVELARPVPGVVPVRINRARTEPGSRIVVAGFGLNGTGLTGPNASDGRLRAATNVVDDTTGNYFNFSFSSPDDATATDLEGIGGPGDSGGPAFVERGGERLLLGVSSLSSTGEAEGPSRYRSTEVYVRTATIAGWIDAVLEGRVTADPPAYTVVDLTAASYPATRGGNLARDFVAAFNAVDSVALARFEATYRNPAALTERSADLRGGGWTRVAGNWGTLRARRFAERGSTVSLLIHASKTDVWMRLIFQLDPETRTYIVAVSTSTPEDPA